MAEFPVYDNYDWFPARIQKWLYSLTQTLDDMSSVTSDASVLSYDTANAHERAIQKGYRKRGAGKYLPYSSRFNAIPSTVQSPTAFPKDARLSAEPPQDEDGGDDIHVAVGDYHYTYGSGEVFEDFYKDNEDDCAERHSSDEFIHCNFSEEEEVFDGSAERDESRPRFNFTSMLPSRILPKSGDDVGEDETGAAFRERFRGDGRTRECRRSPALLVSATQSMHRSPKEDSRRKKGSAAMGEGPYLMPAAVDSLEDTLFFRDLALSSEPTHSLSTIVLAVVYAFCGGALNLSLRDVMYLKKHQSQWIQILAIRVAVAWTAALFSLCISHGARMPLFGHSSMRKWIALRALLMFAAMACSLASFVYLPFHMAITLAMAAPIFISVGSLLVHRGSQLSNQEQGTDALSFFMLALALCGILVMAKPILGESADGFVLDSGHYCGIILGILSAVFCAAQCTLSHLCRYSVHWQQMEHSSLMLSLIVFVPVTLVCHFAWHLQHSQATHALNAAALLRVATDLWAPMSSDRLSFECLMGVLTFCSLALLTRASQFESPSRFSICLFLQMPVTLFAQTMISRAFPNKWSMLGTGLVLFTVTVAVLRKHSIGLSLNICSLPKIGVGRNSTRLLAANNSSDAPSMLKYMSFLPPQIPGSTVSGMTYTSFEDDTQPLLSGPRPIKYTTADASSDGSGQYSQFGTF